MFPFERQNALLIDAYIAFFTLAYSPFYKNAHVHCLIERGRLSGFGQRVLTTPRGISVVSFQLSAAPLYKGDTAGL